MKKFRKFHIVVSSEVFYLISYLFEENEILKKYSYYLHDNNVKDIHYHIYVEFYNYQNIEFVIDYFFQDILDDDISSVYLCKIYGLTCSFDDFISYCVH